MTGTVTPSQIECLTVSVRKTFFPGRAAPFVLEAEFTASPGFTILFGASGAGKTTLLDCIAGLQIPDNGRIAIGDTVLYDSAARVSLPPNVRSAGYLLQSLALFPHMTVEQNVQYGLARLQKSERHARCREILQLFRIEAHWTPW
jgi:molybdate transport system ATP-binding protein